MWGRFGFCWGLLLLACQAQDTGMRVGEQGSLPDDNLPPPSADSSVAGSCRSPADAGCAKCCRIDPNGGMALLSWTGAADDTSGVQPWYNKQEVTPDCPAGVRDCAPCLEREESEYKALAAPDGCDCKAETPGPDPCHALQSCGCYCSRRQRLEPMCGSSD